MGSLKHDKIKLHKELATLTFYLNGALTHDQSLMLSEAQMQIYSDVLKKHFDAQAQALNGNRK
jgi:hypothetical protein